MKNPSLKLVFIGLLLFCQVCVAEEFKLPAYFPFLHLTANQNEVPLTGEPSTIPSDFNKNAVLFLFQKNTTTNYEPLGTSFMVQVANLHYPHIYIPIPFVGKNIILFHPWYLVTAKHVLFDEKDNLRQDVYIRFNNNTNGISWAPLSALIQNQLFRVLFSTNTAVDMAVVTLNIPSKIPKMLSPGLIWPNNISLGAIDSSLLLTSDKMVQYDIKEGYDMFFVGLFVNFYGSNRNFPICRFGHLAMIPDEGISIAGKPKQTLFLMDTPAYGGNSGSPAFFRTERSIPILKTLNLLSSKSGEHDKIILAGIVDAMFTDPYEVDANVPPFRTPLFTMGNAGIAAIVPATYIHEVLFSKDEIKNRKLFFKMLEPKGYF